MSKKGREHLLFSVIMSLASWMRVLRENRRSENTRIEQHSSYNVTNFVKIRMMFFRNRRQTTQPNNQPNNFLIFYLHFLHVRLSQQYDTTVPYINVFFHAMKDCVYNLFLYTVQHQGFHLYGYIIKKILCTSSAKLTWILYLK